MKKMMMAIALAAVCAGCELQEDNDETITVSGDYIVIQNSNGETELVNKPKEEIR